MQIVFNSALQQFKIWLNKLTVYVITASMPIKVRELIEKDSATTPSVCLEIDGKKDKATLGIISRHVLVIQSAV